MKDWIGSQAARFDGWLTNWYRRLSGQLVLSHVFVAVVVLAFALGVAQITFRNFFVGSQLDNLTSQAQTIRRIVMTPFFAGELPVSAAVGDIKLLQGALKDRVLVFGHEGEVVLDVEYGRVPDIRPTTNAFVTVLDGQTSYRGTEAGVAIVGLPVYLGPNNVAGALFLESPLSVSSSAANSLTRLLLFGELGAIVMVGALAYALSARLSDPLAQLRRVVAGSGQQDAGEPRQANEAQGPIEVQELAREFNRLQDRVESQMVQLRREAEARDALLAHVAHDLRTPLTSIRGFLEAVRDGVAVGEQHDRAVEVAWEETLRLQRLVNRLLKATRIKSDTGPLELLSLVSVVEKTLERAQPVMEQNNLAVRWDSKEDAPIWGNEDYFMEALLNLLDNAIKWAPPESVIEVGTKRQGDSVAVWVKDRGPGIPEELLPRVFERFVTGDPSRQQSSGLGLSIVDEVVRQLGGTVQIDSRPGQGTRVELLLPIAPSD